MGIGARSDGILLEQLADFFSLQPDRSILLSMPEIPICRVNFGCVYLKMKRHSLLLVYD